MLNGGEVPNELERAIECYRASERLNIPVVQGGVMDQPYVLVSIVFPAIRESLGKSNPLSGPPPP